MKGKIIKINKEKCNGCGMCAKACHEGAISMIDGKAKLMRDDYCDGFGDCLPACPVNAISFEIREALEYDKAAVEENMRKKRMRTGGCPGSMAKRIEKETQVYDDIRKPMQSCLSQWPVQIKLVPVNAPYFSGAELLIAADCTAYAYAEFHRDFIKNRITLIGCPKLDEGDYREKLEAIISNNDIKSLTVVRMEVPCCGGIENAAKNALLASGKFIPWQVVTLSTEGRVIG